MGYTQEHTLFYDPNNDGEQLRLWEPPLVDTSWATDEMADQGLTAGRITMQLYVNGPGEVAVWFPLTNIEINVGVSNFNILNQTQVRGLASYVLSQQSSGCATTF